MSAPEKLEVLMSLRDFWRILRRHRWKILYSAFLVGVCAFLYAATRPIRYEAEGSFRDKGKSNSQGSNTSLTSLLMVATNDHHSALTVMKSKILVGQLIKKHALQMSIEKEIFWQPFSLLDRFFGNLKTEYALFTHAKTSLFNDFQSDIVPSDLRYEGESYLKLTLHVDSNEGYSLFDEKRELLGKGTFAFPLTTPLLSVTLTHVTGSDLSGKEYVISIIPMRKALQEVQKRFIVKPNSQDKSIVNIAYQDEDRRRAAVIVTDMMNLYTKYIKNENRVFNEEQIAYLQKRREEVGRELKEDMHQCAEACSSDFSHTGFPSSQKAMNFLAQSQASLEATMHANQLEIKRLEQIDRNHIADYGVVISVSTNEILKNLYTDLQQLRRRAASLTLALAAKTVNVSDFQWMSLSAVESLLVNYNTQLHEAQLQIIQQGFVAKELADPNFEVSAASRFISDPVSTTMMTQMSQAMLALRDTENLNTKEQVRLKADLIIQKQFLATHLEQNIALLALHVQFLKEKIIDLQYSALQLVQEEIVLLERQIKEQVVNTIANLKEENALLHQNVIENRVDMKTYPEKWSSERFLEQKIVATKQITTEIARLVETKNINANIERSMAAPFEHPHTPFYPISPHLLLFAVLGGIAGAFFSTVWFVMTSVLKGVEVTADNLKLAGQHVSGHLSLNDDPSHPLDEDLDTLRHVVRFLTQEPITNHTMLLLENGDPHYSKMLAELLHKKGYRCVILDLSLSGLRVTEQEGLLQYLQHECTEIAISHREAYDDIATGGITRYSNELLNSERFKTLLELLSQRYDWVIAYSSVSLHGAEAHSLCQLFSKVAISVKGEPLHTLHPYMEQASSSGFQCTFVIT